MQAQLTEVDASELGSCVRRRQVMYLVVQEVTDFNPASAKHTFLPPLNCTGHLTLRRLPSFFRRSSSHQVCSI
jgi:hypothetical protein